MKLLHSIYKHFVTLKGTVSNEGIVPFIYQISSERLNLYKKKGYSRNGFTQCRMFVLPQINIDMDKDTEIRFVGQPILKQILKLVDAVNIQSIINKHQSDYYYKAFKTRTHIVTMLFGIFSRCDSMTEICEGLRALGGKLNHLGLEKAPAKSTASDGFT